MNMSKSSVMSPVSSSTLTVLSLIFIFIVSSIPYSHQSSPFLTPIIKDQKTLQYTTTVYLKTPLQPTKLVIDLGAQFSWVDCQGNYNSTTYSHIPCDSELCESLNTFACLCPDCANFTCALFPENPISVNSTLDDAIIDHLAVLTTDGTNPGPFLLIPDFVFSCSKNYMLDGLAQNATGLLALGRANYSFPPQLSRSSSLPNIFALCLSGSSTGSGVGFFASPGPYNFLPGKIDLSKNLTYTPLILNPFSDTIITYAQHPSFNYFIGVTGVRINGHDVPINKTLLAIDPESGIGGTRISTVVPYTVLQRSIYDAVVASFSSAAAAMNLTAASPIKPFKACYYASSVKSTILGPAVPTIDLVLGSGTGGEYWRIWGANSVVGVKENKSRRWCLGFMDGGVSPRASIVVGGLQMEENLVQFDLEKKRFGFRSSVLGRRTTCANFNFTVNSGVH